MLRSKSTDPPTNRDLINKIENDLSLLRGEVLRLTELVKILTDFKKKERDEELKSKSSGWIFSNS